MRIGLTLTCLGCIVLSAVLPAGAQSLSKCFRSEWLQGERSVSLTIKGNKVSGTFVVAGGEEPDKEYKFIGRRRGNTLTVAFANHKLPDLTPSELKSLTWVLVRRHGHELLRIKVYGKNYETNKYETSFSYFESCNQEKISSK